MRGEAEPLSEKAARATDVEILHNSGVGHNRSFFGDLPFNGAVAQRGTTKEP